MESFGGGGVVAPASGDVQVAEVFEGRGDGRADGGQVDGAAADAAGGGVAALTSAPVPRPVPPAAGINDL